MNGLIDYKKVFTDYPPIGDESLEKYFVRLSKLHNGIPSARSFEKWWHQLDLSKDRKKAISINPDLIVTGKAELAPQLHDAVHELLSSRKKGHTIESLSDYFNVGATKIREAISTLQHQGKNVRVTEGGDVELSSIIEEEHPTVFSTGLEFKFGVTADNHYCSTYCREDVCNKLYDIFKEEGITTVFQLGNILEGEKEHNKYEIIKSGIGGQVGYLIENFPKRDGIITHFITGDDHEGWWTQREGINVGRHIQHEAEASGRFDLKYLGHMEHDIIMKQAKGFGVMRLIHAGGGSSYATSYTSQKYVESLQAGEKPHIILVGHFHKFDWCYPREVHVIQCGCTQDQSSFMRKKKIAAHVGGVIIRGKQRLDGSIERLLVEWIPFYDKGYYDKAWKYRTQ